MTMSRLDRLAVFLPFSRVWRHLPELFHVKHFLRMRISRLQGALLAFAASSACGGFCF
jgi:hypothetical protein